MIDQTALSTLLSRYQTLCQYSDEAFAATSQVLQAHIRCAKGCAACCTLETVTPLEAYVISSYLQHYSSSSGLTPGATQVNNAGTSLESPTTVTGSPQPEPCVFLQQQSCMIYPARPVICRTHGLPLAYPDNQTIAACPLNFTALDLSALAPRFLFDAERLAHNLLRLNLAFCLIRQQPETAGERIPLRTLRR